jgi:hypothetical protein
MIYYIPAPKKTQVKRDIPGIANAFDPFLLPKPFLIYNYMF